jgi:HK97 family phage major capsid protein
MEHAISRLPIMLAIALAVVAMPQHVYAFNQRAVGVAHGAPWRMKLTAALEDARGAVGVPHRHLQRFLSNERGEIAVEMLVPVPSSIGARLRALKQERANLIKEDQDVLTKAAVDNRDLSVEEIAVSQKLQARIEKLNTDIHAYERVTESDRRMAVTELSSGGAAGSTGEFRSFGEFLQAVACASSPVIANRVRGGNDLVQKLQAYQSAASGMSVGVPGDGGYLVRKDWTTDLLDKARTEAVLFPRCHEITIGADFDGLEYPYIDESSRVDGSRWGGVQVFRKAEAATVTAKQPKIGRGELRLEEIMGLAYVTSACSTTRRR